MQPMRLTLHAPAKINLFLRVKGRRPDGYHLLDTLMQKISLCDELEITLATDTMDLECCGESVPTSKENLVLRAAEFFLRATRGRRKRRENGVSIRLTKRIPVAAGLGGGSSDAAATLRGLNELHGFPCSAKELAGLGLQLGADVPFFLAQTGAARATGIGEVLEPVDSLRNLSILLVNPGFPISTRWAYQTFALTNREEFSSLLPFKEDTMRPLSLNCHDKAMPLLSTMVNDLERVSLARFPEIDRIKALLLQNGAVKALMSGSGPTVFGLFAEQQQSSRCSALFKSRFVHTYMVESV